MEDKAVMACACSTTNSFTSRYLLLVTYLKQQELCHSTIQWYCCIQQGELQFSQSFSHCKSFSIVHTQTFSFMLTWQSQRESFQWMEVLPCNCESISLAIYNTSSQHHIYMCCLQNSPGSCSVRVLRHPILIVQKTTQDFLLCKFNCLLMLLQELLSKMFRLRP